MKRKTKFIDIKLFRDYIAIVYKILVRIVNLNQSWEEKKVYFIIEIRVVSFPI
jgi:hypothetical protein